MQSQLNPSSQFKFLKTLIQTLVGALFFGLLSTVAYATDPLPLNEFEAGKASSASEVNENFKLLKDLAVSSANSINSITSGGTVPAPPNCFGANEALRWKDGAWICGTFGAAPGPLFAHYTFDTTDVGRDSVGTYTTFDHNDVTQTTTDVKVGTGALSSPGNGSGLRIAADIDFEPDTFTIAFWLKPNTLSNGPFILAHQGKSSGLRAYGVYARSDGKVFFVTTNVGTFETSVESSATISVGTWTHIAISYGPDANGDTRRTLYINGMSNNSNVVTSELEYSSPLPEKTYFGQHIEVNSRSFDGVLDDLRFYREVIPEADICAVAQLGDASIDCSGL